MIEITKMQSFDFDDILTGIKLEFILNGQKLILHSELSFNFKNLAVVIKNADTGQLLGSIQR